MAFTTVRETDDEKILGGDDGESPVKPPPRRRGRPPGSTTKAKPKAPAAPPVPLSDLRKMVEGWHIKAGMLLAMQPVEKYRPIGVALIEDAEKGSAYIVKQAQKSPKFRKALENMARGSNVFEFFDAYGHLILCVMMLAAPGAAASLAPFAETIFGVETPVTQSDETDVPAATQSDGPGFTADPLFTVIDGDVR